MEWLKIIFTGNALPADKTKLGWLILKVSWFIINRLYSQNACLGFI